MNEITLEVHWQPYTIILLNWCVIASRIETFDSEPFPANIGLLGKIENSRVWNRTLTIEEIKSAMRGEDVPGQVRVEASNGNS